MDNEASFKLLLITLARMDKHFNLVNLKASLILPANALLLGFLLRGHDKYLGLLKDSSLSYFTMYTYVGILISIFLSATFAIKVVVSFLKSGSKSGAYVSLIYFGSIAEMELDVYLRKSREIEETPFIEDLGRQVHLLSNTVKRKFELCNWSLGALFVSFFLATITMVIDAFV